MGPTHPFYTRGDPTFARDALGKGDDPLPTHCVPLTESLAEASEAAAAHRTLTLSLSLSLRG